MNLSFSLYRLQTLDTQRQKINKRLAQIEAALNADEEVRLKLQEKTQAEEELAARLAPDLDENKVRLSEYEPADQAA